MANMLSEKTRRKLAEFDKLWWAYGYYECRGAAKRYYLVNDLPPLQVLLSAINKQRACRQMSFKYGLWVPNRPYLKNWLKNERWADEVASENQLLINASRQGTLRDKQDKVRANQAEAELQQQKDSLLFASANDQGIYSSQD